MKSIKESARLSWWFFTIFLAFPLGLVIAYKLLMVFLGVTPLY